MKGVGVVRSGGQRPRRSTRSVSPGFVAVVATAVTAALALLPITAQPALAAPCVSTPSGLVALWPGDGSTDESVAGRSGTLVGDTGYAVGEVAQAFTFDGDGDMVTVPDAPEWTLGSDDFTIDFWIFFDDPKTATPLISHQAWISYWWVAYNGAGGLVFERSDGGYYSWAEASWTPNPGHWYNVAVVREGTEFRFYVDGTLVGSQQFGAVLTIPDVDAPLRLGGNEDGSAFAGRLDEIQIYSQALPGTDLASLTAQGRTCAPAHATLTLSGPSTALPGQRVALSGALSFTGATAVGQVVDITRAVGSQAPVPLGTATVGAGGEFTFADSAPLGVVTYRATFEGDASLGAAFGATTVTVRKGTSRLTLDLSRARVEFGESLTVTAHLVGGRSNRVVTIYAQPYGGSRSVVAQGRVTRKGELSVKVAPRSTTVYSAHFDGDAAWRSADSRSRRVVVSARWTTRYVGADGREGKYRLFRWARTCRRSGGFKGCPEVALTLAPNHAGTRVGIYYQVLVDGHWRSLGTSSAPLSTRSSRYAFIWYTSREVVGVPFRIRAYFPGDSDHARAWSEWAYLKVIA